MAKKKKEMVENYLNYIIKKVKIINQKGAVLVLQSGTPPPPPNPPGGPK
ncbi:MAG TPA: hypothetical protein VK589_25530 [Chryseolinea sp.]|nr:hypothetical protein [Chryseolinea sp.]